ncbi:MAG: protein phosphatase 2C domain-containing protein [Gammaproteobacteria bacterium]|nr:protein phosphatase 2C domain-containing protein [Gammaproteobacteria bacterium]MDE0479398.1 protein phosphatase 2C domain-containing protein [Gammaproteobacteria bacterium]
MTGKKFKLHIAGKTDTGMLREHNEDFIGFDEDAALAVLADGLGGRASGEVASCMAVTSILTELRPDRPLQAEAGDLFDELLRAIDAANRRIFYAANANKCHNGMSTTLVAARIEGRRMLAGCVGDSRLYLLRDRELTQLSRDHSLINDLLAKGAMPNDDFSLTNIDHILTRALGIHDAVEIDRLEHELQGGDLLLMCSDGLTNMVADWEIKDILNGRPDDIDLCVKRLVDSANRNGGKDNVSVILMRIE